MPKPNVPTSDGAAEAERARSSQHAPLPSPDPLWYKDAIIYQCHVKAFFDSNGDGTGDFVGLTRKLDYIRDLGVTAIWLLPFYPSPMRDDGYDIADYHNINPAYGTRRDFRRFVTESHRRGIRVIIELVINHTSDQHQWFQAARRAPKGSSKRDFYIWNDDDLRFAETRIIFTDSENSNWAWDPVAEQYYWHRFFSHQPDLNHNNPQVVRAVIRIMRFWLDLGVDGLRLDAIPYLCVRDGTNNENLPETHAVIKQMRAEVDAHYRDRMLLGEANQWPEDVRDYFGDGDECHMAYHFPLMPRMYMALAQEDRHPIVEIMEQTPEIPPNCQWAIFLRNHDELTLEMVSDRERDYLYQAYAADPRMRINVGIRRRLAPLLGNDQDRIRLMFSLLLSMPGSPVLYYGDELGMGDNIYLGDRNAVRTPMQWSPDRNAGFSRADPEQLYLPPVMDPIYGYLSINAEAQDRASASLLNWMRRVIVVRKAHRLFGRGRMELLHPGNRKILAYLRAAHPDDPVEDGECLLCIANLGRGAQPVELDLTRYKGRVPIELLGQTVFPPIGELPYLLTLPGHGFYWFLLSREAQAPTWHDERVPPPRLPTLVLPEGLRSLQPELAERRDPALRARALFEAMVLPLYLDGHFRLRLGGSGIVRVRIIDCMLWADSLLTLIEVEHKDGSRARLLLPLVLVWQANDVELALAPPASSVLARVRRRAMPGLLNDAFASEAFVHTLIAAIGEGETIPLERGRLRLQPTAAFARLAAAQSQSSFRVTVMAPGIGAVLDERLVLKPVLSRGREGDARFADAVEQLEYLTEAGGFGHMPSLAARIWYQVEADTPSQRSLVGLLLEYLPNQGNLRELTQALVQRLCDAYGERVDAWLIDPAQISIETLYRALGARIAEMHRILSNAPVDGAFAPVALSEQALAEHLRQMALAVQATLSALDAHLNQLAAALRSSAANLMEQRHRLDGFLFGPLPGAACPLRISIHGDLRLERVLVTENDIALLEADSGPAQVAAAAGFAEADHKQPALVDSARVLQSLHEVVATVWLSLEDSATSSRQRLQRPLARWRRHIAGIFVDAYLNAAFENDVLRDDAARTSRQLIGRFAVFGAVTAVQDTWTETEQPFQTALETASSLLGDGWLDTQP